MRESPSQDVRAYVALGASNEKIVGVRFGVLNEVNGCLLCGDSDEKVATRGTRLSMGLNQTILGRSIGCLGSSPRSPSRSQRSASCFSLVAAEDGRSNPRVPENSCPGIRSTTTMT